MSPKYIAVYLLLVICLNICSVFSIKHINSPIEPKTTAQNARPPPHQRRFVSKAIDAAVTNITSKMKDPELATIFSNCLPNTLDTTVYFTKDSGVAETFVITGDIFAMWFRDSTNQVFPYVSFVNDDPELDQMIQGLIRKHMQLVLLDPYANAFNLPNAGQISGFMNDNTWKPGFLNTQVPAMTTALHERKYELDSLCAVMKLAWEYYRVTNDTTLFSTLDTFQPAMMRIIEVIRDMQRSSDDILEGGALSYYFQRAATNPTDTLMFGIGAPGAKTGMSRSPFRSSDDASTFPYIISSNAMAVVTLRQMAIILSKLNNQKLSDDAVKLSNEIDAGIKQYGIVNHPTYGQIYAYEVDGYGSHILMDDAGIPSLLSLPLIGYCDENDPIYINTRKFVLSNNNPYFSKGTAGEGIGGPHIGLGHIWPMSILVRALTSNDDQEIANQLAMLKSSSAGTGFMHESFWKDNAGDFTRPWFAWVNSLFGQLILTLAKDHPNLIF